MSNEILNIIFVVITLGFTGLTFLVNFFGKKFKNNYFFWAIPSLFFLIYFIVFRFWDAWVNFDNYLSTNGSIWLKEVSTRSYSLIVSKALLLDMCPFVALALPLSLIVDKTRRVATAIAPFAILGGGITIPFIASSDANAELTWEYIFVGVAPNQIYFFMHFYLVVFGTMVLSNSRKRKWTQLIDIHLFAVIYFAYICFVAFTTNVTYNVTGISANDWSSFGEYGQVSVILGVGWPYVMIISFILAYVFIVGITSINIAWKRHLVKIGKEKKEPRTLKLKKIKRIEKRVLRNEESRR